MADGETQHPAADPPRHGADDYDRRSESLLYRTMGEIALAAGGRVAAYWLAKVDAAIAESAG